jgi:hypothetical protein
MLTGVELAVITVIAIEGVIMIVFVTSSISPE